MVQFRSRWFWRTYKGWIGVVAGLFKGFAKALVFRPDLWLTYHTYYKSPDVIGPWMSRILGIPYVLFQPMYATRRRKDPSTRVGFYLNLLALKSCHYAFTNNLNDVQALERVLPADRVEYIPPGIFPEEFERNELVGKEVRLLHRIPEGFPIILTAARFRPGIKYRSLEYLFQSLNLLARRTAEPFVLLAVGGGPLDREIREMGQALLGEQVIFAGQIPREEMASYYSAADIFAFPGVDETLGMVFLEAQACGLPVVALNGAGVPQVVVDNKTGLLVPEDGGVSMALAVGKLLTDAGMRRELGLNGISYVREQRNLHINYSRLVAKIARIV